MIKLNKDILTEESLIALAIQEDLKMRDEKPSGNSTKATLELRKHSVAMIRKELFIENLVMVYKRIGIYTVYRYEKGYYEELYDIHIAICNYYVGAKKQSTCPKIRHYGGKVKYSYFCTRLLGDKGGIIYDNIYKIDNMNYDKNICKVSGDGMYVNINKLLNIKRIKGR